MVKIRIDKIIIEHKIDENPDLSYLQQDYADVKNKKERQKYLAQDKKRLEEYNAGNWYMIGITARAEVSYEMTNVMPRGNRRIEWLTSGGLWGIESDSEEKYIQEIENEQAEDLRLHLKTFGVDVKNFSRISRIHKQ